MTPGHDQPPEKIAEKKGFYTFQSLLDAEIIIPWTDMSIALDYMKYLVNPKEFDELPYIAPCNKTILESGSKYNRRLAEYTQKHAEYFEGLRIKQSAQKVKASGILVWIWDTAYRFKDRTTGNMLEKEFFGESQNFMDKNRFDEMLAWMNQARMRQQLRVEALVRQTSQNIEDIMPSWNSIITYYMLVNLIRDSSAPIGGGEPTEISGGGWDFGGGWGTWDNIGPEIWATGEGTWETGSTTWGSDWNI